MVKKPVAAYTSGCGSPRFSKLLKLRPDVTIKAPKSRETVLSLSPSPEPPSDWSARRVGANEQRQMTVPRPPSPSTISDTHSSRAWKSCVTGLKTEHTKSLRHSSGEEDSEVVLEGRPNFSHSLANKAATSWLKACCSSNSPSRRLVNPLEATPIAPGSDSSSVTASRCTPDTRFWVSSCPDKDSSFASCSYATSSIETNPYKKSDRAPTPRLRMNSRLRSSLERSSCSASGGGSTCTTYSCPSCRFLSEKTLIRRLARRTSGVAPLSSENDRIRWML
mmetsp:Transcript_15113/g.57434  ORF Transcript_15113/g.57434 Transcript_15113/m.57434 type:complete len:278 (-) Transcript_15113:2875-3708(-)